MEEITHLTYRALVKVHPKVPVAELEHDDQKLKPSYRLRLTGPLVRPEELEHAFMDLFHRSIPVSRPEDFEFEVTDIRAVSPKPRLSIPLKFVETIKITHEKFSSSNPLRAIAQVVNLCLWLVLSWVPVYVLWHMLLPESFWQRFGVAVLCCVVYLFSFAICSGLWLVAALYIDGER